MDIGASDTMLRIAVQSLKSGLSIYLAHSLTLRKATLLAVCLLFALTPTMRSISISASSSEDAQCLRLITPHHIYRIDSRTGEYISRNFPFGQHLQNMVASPS